MRTTLDKINPMFGQLRQEIDKFVQLWGRCRPNMGEFDQTGAGYDHVRGGGFTNNTKSLAGTQVWGLLNSIGWGSAGNQLFWRPSSGHTSRSRKLVRGPGEARLPGRARFHRARRWMNTRATGTSDATEPKAAVPNRFGRLARGPITSNNTLAERLKSARCSGDPPL